MRAIVEWCLNHRSVVILAALLVFGGGIFAASELKRELLPQVDFPVLVINTPVPGGSPDSVADQVTEPIERALSGLTGLERHRSFSVDGFSTVIAEYQLNVNTEEAQTELERALNDLVLPEEALAPQVSSISFESQATIRFAVIADEDSLAELTTKVEEDVIPLLRKADGAGAVQIRGGESQRIEVRLEPERLAENNISADQVIGALRANNLSVPAGSVLSEDKSVPVRVAGEIKSLDELKKLVVGVRLPAAASPALAGIPSTAPSPQTSAAEPALPGETVPGLGEGAQAPGAGEGAALPSPTGQGVVPGDGVIGATAAATPQLVTLDDLAGIEVEVDSGGGVSRTNGEPSLGIDIIKEQNANTVVLSESVQEILPEVREALDGNDVELIFDNAVFIQDQIDSLLTEGLIGAGLVILIIYLFLRSGRATLVTALSIPTSLLVALIFAFSGELSLNVMTLTGLTIAIGRVIDDAIVVLENIYSKMQMGEDNYSAALNGTSEVVMAIASSTLAAIAVFLPIGLVGGVISRFFLTFSLIVAGALLASLIVSLTLVPVLANLLLRPGKVRPGEAVPLLQRVYQPLLRWSLRHRLATVAIGAAVFVGGVALLPQIPQNFLPDTGQTELFARVELPAGTRLAETSRRLEDFEKAVDEEDEIVIYSTDIGGEDPFGQGAGVQASSEATVWMRVEEDAEVDPILTRLQERGKGLYGDSFRLQQVQGGPQSGRVELVVVNADLEELRQANDAIVSTLTERDDIENVRSDLSEAKPEFAINVNREKASQAGLTTLQVAQTLRTLLQGQRAGEIPVNGNALPLFVASLRSSADDVKDLEALPVGLGANGKLGDIAEIAQVDGPVTVGRSDGERAATVTGRITTQDTAQVSGEIDEAINELNLPSGTSVRIGGESEDIQTAFRDMAIAIAVAIVLVYLVLVVFFGSLLHPFTIILSLPLAIIGALGALLITGKALGLPALLGILMLTGIVVANAILLVDFIQRARGRGESKLNAELLAGRRRLRPILMTALVTIGALTPMAMGVTGGFLISSSLATVVIGGLATSTLLTLVIIPTVYSLFDSMRVRIFGEQNGPPTPPTEDLLANPFEKDRIRI